MLPDAQTELTLIYHTLVGQYIDIGCFVVTFFEWIITFDLEVEHVWNSKWGFMKSIYLVNRFLPVVEFVLVCIRDHGFIPTRLCKPMFSATGCIFIAAMCIAEYTFALRTCAVWEMNKKLRIALTLGFLGILAYSTYNWILSVTPLQYFAIPPLEACVAFQSKVSKIYVNYIILAVYDAVMLCMMIYPTVKKYRHRHEATTRPEVMKTIYTEGTLFYAYLLVLSFAALVMERQVPDEIYLFSSINRTIRPVLGCRIILHIRELSAKRRGSISAGGDTSRISELRFT